MIDGKTLKFNADGLIPVIARDVRTGEVLMLAYMNAESLRLTQETGRMHYFSRSRNELWEKGATSGHIQEVRELCADCDRDTLLATVEQTGPACHTGAFSCFYEDGSAVSKLPRASVLREVSAVIADRKANPKEGSYTNYLFDKGLDKILKKIGEESSEVIIAAKNRANGEICYEAADLLYHLMVLMEDAGIRWDDIFAELEKRR
jgi:phosphoribosyl-ATP pyrophosphohydrolase/phosphoribosyl-AMP cyclohydrolase